MKQAVRSGIGVAVAILVAVSIAANALAKPPKWAEQGPGPTQDGQDEGLPNNPEANRHMTGRSL